MQIGAGFIVLCVLAGCGHKGKTCDTDSDCDGRQQCWCSTAPLSDQCVNRDDLPAGECVSNHVWVQREEQAEARLQAKSETLARRAVKKLYPKCVEQLSIVGVTPNILYHEYSARVDGIVSHEGKLCTSVGDNCQEGQWRVRVRVYLGGDTDGTDPHYTSGYIEEASGALPEGHADVYLSQVCR